MKQVWYHYTLWEDFQNGMYNEQKEGRKERVQMAIYLLQSPTMLYVYMKRVTEEWKHATEQTLTNPSINHQAWLGQCACNLFGGVKEDETREAWGHLTNMERYEANKVADKVDEEWVRQYTKCHDSYQLSIFDEEVFG